MGKHDKAVINESLCVQNHNCPVVKACPIGAVTQKKEGHKWEMPHIDPLKCAGCGWCFQACERSAVHFK